MAYDQETVIGLKSIINFWGVKLQYDRPFLAISVATQIELTIKYLKERLKQELEAKDDR